MRAPSNLFSQAFLQTLVLHLLIFTSSSWSLNLSTMSPSPALSPDISPLFPTPSRSMPTPSPVQPLPSLPIISSSPSPPDPDGSVSSTVPGTAASPTGFLPESSGVAVTPSGSSMAVLLLLLAAYMAPNLIAIVL